MEGNLKSIIFSPALTSAIQREIDINAQDLGEDGLEGVEEIIGDNLTGDAQKEYHALVDQYGFDKISKAVKLKFLTF